MGQSRTGRRDGEVQSDPAVEPTRAGEKLRRKRTWTATRDAARSVRDCPKGPLAAARSPGTVRAVSPLPPPSPSDGEGSSHVLPSQGMTVKGPDCQMNKLRRVPLTMGSHRMSLRFCFVFEARLTPPWSFHHSPEYLSPLLLDSELPEDRGQPQRLTVLDT